MDIGLPELDGIKALTEIREFCPDTPVIIISACTDFTYVREAMHLQVKDFLPKPVRPLTIKQAFQKIYLPSMAPSASPALEANVFPFHKLPFIWILLKKQFNLYIGILEIEFL